MADYEILFINISKMRVKTIKHLGIDFGHWNKIRLFQGKERPSEDMGIDSEIFPGLGRGLVASLDVDGVGLPLVLGDGFCYFQTVEIRPFYHYNG